MSLQLPPGLHRDDHLHEGESATQWINACDERMARRKTEYSIGARHAAMKERAERHEPIQPGYTPIAVVEELSALDPDFDRQVDRFDKIMSWYSSDTCCPGYSYLGRGHCPEHGG